MKQRTDEKLNHWQRIDKIFFQLKQQFYFLLPNFDFSSQTKFYIFECLTVDLCECVNGGIRVSWVV